MSALIGTAVIATPNVILPGGLENASHARGAVQHFARKLELWVYPTENSVWRASNDSPVDDGRHDRGEPVKFDIYGTWQPNTLKRARGLIEGPEASETESVFIVHLDSHDPRNLEAVAARDDIFPNGLRLVDPDDRGTDGIVNHPMAIMFRGNKYKVQKPLALYAGGVADQDVQGAIYRAECSLWEDRYQEREARSNGREWGPE